MNQLSVPVVNQTSLQELTLFGRGKVRDIYDLDDFLLIVVTDRLSAFDVVLPDPIPMKGIVLNLLSAFWFEQTAHIVPHHMVSIRVEEYPSACAPYGDVLRGRSMLVRKAEPLPIECVVRGYLSGSGWKEYRKTGAVCGISLPDGLQNSSKLDQPIFTPSTKAEEGHDENISFDQAAEIVGREVAEEVRRVSLELYTFAREQAARQGIIIADTKFEFGYLDGRLLLIDEALTPDSSRFWPAALYKPGAAQPSFDKQYVRDYLEELEWDKTPPAPSLPDDVIRRTTEKYVEAYSLITGKDIAEVLAGM
ncbi:MAG: phosphoribosylaminoimidazolesuccinocarboxamide synthase [Chlorobi bacterium]|nr:phosphoribosylaminoimidazolesuccinocarboxamide synthase [Chlorobiota bacterium]